MGHPQPATPMKTDNSTASGISNQTVKQKCTCAMDMRFYWVRNHVQQQQLLVYWQPGTENIADYFTKHHGTPHHCAMRPIFLVPQCNVLTASTLLQGCAKLTTSVAHAQPTIPHMQLRTTVVRPTDQNSRCSPSAVFTAAHQF